MSVGIQIMAHFEELLAEGRPVVVETLDGMEAEGLVEGLDDGQERVVVHVHRPPAGGLDPGATARLYFFRDGERWVGSCTVRSQMEDRTRFALSLPATLERSDRREAPRLAIHGEARTSLWMDRATGPVLRGRLLDLSLTGFRILVEEAREGHQGPAVDLSTLFLEQGQPVDVLEIQGLGEAVSSGARIMEILHLPRGMTLGLRFRNLAPGTRDFLARYLLGQLPQAVQDPPPGTAFPGNRTAEMRLKRFRTLALVMPPGPARTAVQTYLASMGFTRIIPLGSLPELARAFQGRALDLAFIDWPDPAPSRELPALLAALPWQEQPALVLAEGHLGSSWTRATREAGIRRVLTRPYELGPRLVSFLLETLEEA